MALRKQSTAGNTARFGALVNRRQHDLNKQIDCRNQMREFVDQNDLRQHFTAEPTTPTLGG